MKLFTVTVIAALAASALAYCPNACSGHGTCGANDRCSCYANWMGSDCSMRECASHLAWVDAPSANNVAHAYAECSNKGTCDRESGLCVCDAGYEGKACQRMSCPNDCSGHGTCKPIESLSSYTYTEWDMGKAQACVCDGGYSGLDCSQRMCPTGDDPLTADQQDRIYLFNMYGDRYGEFVFHLKDNFGTTWTTRPLAYGRFVKDGEAAVGTATASGATLPESDIPTTTHVRVGDVLVSGGGLYHRLTGKTGTDYDVKPDVVGGQTLQRHFAGSSAADVASAFEDLPNGVADVSVALNSTYTGALADHLTPTHGAGVSYSITFHYPSNFVASDALVADWSACTATGCSPYKLGLSTLGSTSYSYTSAGATVTLGGTYAQSITATNTADSAFANHGLVELKMTDATNAIMRTNTNGAYAAAQDFAAGVVVFDGVEVTLAGGVADEVVFVELPFGVELYDITPLTCAEDYREAIECSGRGICDYETGICQCFQGYTDDDCSVQSTLV